MVSSGFVFVPEEGVMASGCSMDLKFGVACATCDTLGVACTNFDTGGMVVQSQDFEMSRNAGNCPPQDGSGTSSSGACTCDRGNENAQCTEHSDQNYRYHDSTYVVIRATDMRSAGGMHTCRDSTELRSSFTQLLTHPQHCCNSCAFR